ncbi:MAG: hypothetical protein AB7E81_18025 [Hyphomicrobiaceae bacterium]
MRSFLALLVAAGGFAAFTTDAQACSVRGTYCDYPNWAANAFEGPYGSPSKGQIDDDRFAYGEAYEPRNVYGYRSEYRARRHYGYRAYR